MKFNKSNRRRDAIVGGYILPEIVDPPETLCVCVPVPDEPMHRAAFLGQLLELARWYTWQRDEAHVGKDVAEVWNAIWVNVRDQMALQPRNCCGCPDDDLIYRINDEGQVESSDDGGVTWELAPQADPRNNVTTIPPVTGGSPDAHNCQMANSAVGALQDAVAQMVARKEAGAGVSAIADNIIAILLFFGVFGGGLGIIIALVMAVATLIFLADAVAFEAAFTTGVWQDLLCLIFCAYDEDGNISESDWASIKGTIRTNQPGIAGDTLYNLINALGAKGLENASRSGFDAGLECTDCGCSDYCHFTTQDNLGGGDARGTFLGNFEDPVTHEIWQRYQSTNGGTSTQSLFLNNNDPDDCCEFIESRVITNPDPIVAYYEIQCGNPQVIESLENTWVVGACLNFLACQSTTGSDIPFIIELRLKQCD